MAVKEKNLNDLAPYYFHQGTNYEAYKYLGCHLEENDGRLTYIFRTWAPNAARVSVIADFNSWNSWDMQRVTEGGIWELKYESDRDLDGTFYKFEITGRNGVTWQKSDPYAFYSETLTKTASIIKCRSDFKWNDSPWFKHRKKIFTPTEKNSYFYSAPMNIYEMHLGSWKTRDGACTADGEHYLTYREIADELAPYVKKMGYTHVELMPIMEHPFDGSWGYQVCSYYAPTSRFGSPDDFRYFVNKLHTCGIGVILDWVPAHFPKDRHGLFEFDGEPLYEYQGKDRMEHKGWGTRCFDVGRNEVQCFLISNALYWLREFHIDGLRVDAVASMLYLDYDREPGEWIPNKNGDNKNLEAIAFFQKLNATVFGEFCDILMIAEESTAWPMITKPVSDGGLGFNFKWNMGWANDMFEYVSLDPYFRKHHHSKLTFPMMYAYSENYILPVSHDEVVHGKKSLVDKMFGEYDQKFAGMRAFLVYMMTLPGKKMMFMGCEYAQFREWDFENQLQWFMLDYPRHTEMQRFVAQINNFYLSSPELWEIDTDWAGFEWIDPNNADENIISYRRKSVSGKELIVVINFSPVERRGFKVRVPKSGYYAEVLTTDEYRFGGGNLLNSEPVKSFAVTEGGGKADYIEINLPSFGGVIFKKQAKAINRKQ